MYERGLGFFFIIFFYFSLLTIQCSLQLRGRKNPEERCGLRQENRGGRGRWGAYGDGVEYRGERVCVCVRERVICLRGFMQFIIDNYATLFFFFVNFKLCKTAPKFARILQAIQKYKKKIVQILHTI